MAVMQLKDGRWVVCYRKGTNLQFPQREREYFGRDEHGRKAAVARDQELKEMKSRRKVARDGSPLFCDIADSYMAANTANISATDLQALFWKLRGVINHVIGNKPCMSISHNVLDSFVASRLQAGRKKTTVHRELSYIRAILNWAVGRRLLSSSPFTGYRMPKRDDKIIAPPTHEKSTRPFWRTLHRTCNGSSSSPITPDCDQGRWNCCRSPGGRLTWRPEP